MNSWLSLLLASDAPALPQTWAMRMALTLGWSLVLALLGAGLGWRLSLPRRRLLALCLAGWTLLPGTLTPDYWLGLAFHAPSLSAILLCVWMLWRTLFPSGMRLAWPHAGGTNRGYPSMGSIALLLVAVLMGYALLLDTFAVLAVQLYSWGFSPLLLLGLLAGSLLPWILGGAGPQQKGPALWVAPMALLLFAATRLPTGNVWDALLDPWLWLLLHGQLLRQCYRRLRG